jgi:S-adenosylmethionine:tRNA ribosyltransferase-isomerase
VLSVARGRDRWEQSVKTDAFDYPLPQEAVADRPLRPRSACRLLVLERDRIHDARFGDLTRWLTPGDLVVVNDTRVLRARLDARRPGGGRLEILLVEIESPERALALVHGARRLRAAMSLELEGGERVVAEERRGEHWCLRTCGAGWEEIMERVGSLPIPPYLGREANEDDDDDYQTVFARNAGSVASPTAGLHFDSALLDRLTAAGVGIDALTLHVGAGTFTPVRTEEIEDHRMHAESYAVSAALAARIAEVRARGRRVVAVGTTVVRALESYARVPASERGEPYAGRTDLYIRPGFRFVLVDALVTNFHAPRSSLLVLVSAFAGRERILEAYRHALAQGYRFLSYGDAMFITAPHAF